MNAQYFFSYVFRGNATLCVSPIAIVRVGRRRRRDKMFSAQYVANDITFLQKIFSDFILSLRIIIGASLVAVASRVSGRNQNIHTFLIVCYIVMASRRPVY